MVLLDDGVTFAIKDGPTDATLFDHYHHTPAARIRAPLNVRRFYNARLSVSARARPSN